MIFAKTPHKDQTITCKRHLWYSRDRQYRVVLSESLFGLSDVYYAEHWDAAQGGMWDVISKHRRKSAATKSCNKHARQ
jgi:hypothetical protein